MTIQDLLDIIDSCPYKDKQVVLTLGYKKFRVERMEYDHGSAAPVEVKLEEVKE